MPEFDIKKFDISKNNVITASAGTGKTYNIVRIVEKLLDNGIPLNKILIVTYTEKAAGELKDRIRKKVGDSENVDAATIGTIHSFCQQTIDEFFITSGKQAHQKLIDQKEAAKFLKQYLRTGAIADEICALKKDQLDIFNIDVSKVNINNASKKIDTIKKSFIKTEVEKTVSNKLISIIEKYYLTRNYSEDKQIIILDTGHNPDFDKLFESYHNHPTKTFSQRIYDNPKLISNTITAGKYITVLANDIAVRYAADFYKAWQLEKAKRGEQTFNDMLRNVREEVVNERPLLNKLRDKYQYAIIDEFQDTNQLQWDIFRKVFLEDAKHHLTVVGDEKQSIYSFRGADLDVFRSAVSEIIDKGGDHYELSKNFRSTSDIIESTNSFFGGGVALTSPNSFTDSACGNVNFEVKYQGDNTDAFWICGKDNVADPKTYAKVVCQTISDCCTLNENNETKLRIKDKKIENGIESYVWRNVTFGDFAILARTRTEMIPIVKALDDSGIPYIKYKDASLFTGIECSHWIAILEAVVVQDFTGKNRVKFKNALFTKFFGYSLEKLTDPKYDKDSIPEIGQFGRWKKLEQSGAWEELIDSLIMDSRLTENLSDVNHLKSLGTFKQIGEYCIEYLSSASDLSALILNLKFLRNGAKDEENEDNDGIVAQSTDFNCVKVMTIHASKGLEFPVVISVSGFKGPKTSDDVYEFHGDNKTISLTKDSKWEQEMAQEWQRFFYVAYTRAKYVLMLPHYAPTSSKPENPFNFISESIAKYGGAYRPLEDNGQPLEDVKAIVSHIISKTSSKLIGTLSADDQLEVLKKMISEKQQHSTRKYSYSTLTHHCATIKDNTVSETGINVDNEDVDEDTEIIDETMVAPLEAVDNGVADYDTSSISVDCEYDTSVNPIALSDSFPAGADLGNALHDIFEVIDYTQSLDDPDYNNKVDEIIRNCFKEYGFKVKDEWVDDVKNMVRNVVSANLPVIHGSAALESSIQLNQVEFKDRKNEVEFNFNKENVKLRQYFNGFIDLIFRQGEYYSILDWKSDRLNDIFTSYSDTEIVKQRVDEHYSIQRVLYAYCLIEWLKNFYKGATEDEIFEKHFGGVYYVFLRGCNENTGNGIYAQTWGSFGKLKEAYDKILKGKVTEVTSNDME